MDVSAKVREWYDGAVPLKRFIESEQSEGFVIDEFSTEE